MGPSAHRLPRRSGRESRDQGNSGRRGAAGGDGGVDVEAGLARLRRTHRRRNATRVAGAALVVAGVVGGGALVLDGTDRAAPPVDRGPVENRDPSPGHGIVHGVAPGPAGTPVPEVLSLPDAGAASFPAWQAFDQDTGRFLFTRVPHRGNPSRRGRTSGSVRTMRVLAPGLEKPVATIHCAEQCNWLHSFGPGRDEVTTLVSPVMRGRRMAQVWGFDGVLRDEIDLSGVPMGRGVADLEWSPDGSRLAVSTFWGAWEPDCPGEPPTARRRAERGRVYLFDRAGGDPELVYRQRAQRPHGAGRRSSPTSRGPPTASDSAWSPPPTATAGNRSRRRCSPSTSSRARQRRSTSSTTPITTTSRPSTGSPGRRTGHASRSPAEPASPSSPRTGDPSPRPAATAPVPWPGSPRRTEQAWAWLSTVPGAIVRVAVISASLRSW